MKKKIFVILIFFSCLNYSIAQQEISVFLGTSIYHGDVGYNSLKIGNSDQLFKNGKIAWGLNFRNNFNERFCVNIGFRQGIISAYDSQSEDLFIVNRNLDFQSKISQLSTNIEFNFTHYKIGSNKFNKTI